MNVSNCGSDESLESDPSPEFNYGYLFWLLCWANVALLSNGAVLAISISKVSSQSLCRKVSHSTGRELQTAMRKSDYIIPVCNVALGNFLTALGRGVADTAPYHQLGLGPLFCASAHFAIRLCVVVSILGPHPVLLQRFLFLCHPGSQGERLLNRKTGQLGVCLAPWLLGLLCALPSLLAQTNFGKAA